jgi:glycosyltransferase involved in cell wall biosynthesis
MAGLVEDWCRETSFDVVHFDTIGLAPYLDMTGRTRKVLDHHNIESDMMIRRAKNATNIIKRAYYYQEGMRLRWYEKKVCPRFDVNITCSKLDSERLRGIVPNVEVAEVPNGVDIEYFSPRTATVKPHSLVFAGNMTWYPNQDAMRFFVELIWPLLKSRIPDVSMDIIGANSPERLSAYTDVDPRLRIHGFVKDVRPFLAESQVYICPIRDGGGTKLKILDALAMGKAIVAHPIACEGINVTSGRNIMFATSPAGFATAVQGLFEDPVRRSKMEISARELAVTEYSYESIGRKLAELYVGHVS